MPVFQETSNAARDLRILPSRALPLPRLSARPEPLSSAEESREVVVIGVSMELGVKKNVITNTFAIRLGRVVFS